jgi:hypothetical protein
MYNGHPLQSRDACASVLMLSDFGTNGAALSAGASASRLRSETMPAAYPHQGALKPSGAKSVLAVLTPRPSRFNGRDVGIPSTETAPDQSEQI